MGEICCLRRLINIKTTLVAQKMNPPSTLQDRMARPWLACADASLILTSPEESSHCPVFHLPRPSRAEDVSKRGGCLGITRLSFTPTSLAFCFSSKGTPQNQRQLQHISAANSKRHRLFINEPQTYSRIMHLTVLCSQINNLMAPFFLNRLLVQDEDTVCR